MTIRVDRPRVWAHGQRLVNSSPRSPIRLTPHHKSPDPNNIRDVRRWLAEQKRPWAIDLFCGAGGLSLGLREAGFSVIVSADSDATALESHSHNFGGLSWHGDLSDPSRFLAKLAAWGIDKVDLVAGGPPCQPFSKAGSSKIRSLVRDGKRPVNDPRVDLWQSFFGIVETLTPKAILFENVPEFASAQHGRTLFAFLDELKASGYEPYSDVIDAWRYGVPQRRKRLFIVALQMGYKFAWPEPQSEFWTLGDAIEDLPNVQAGQQAETLEYDRKKTETTLTRWFRNGLDNEEKKSVHDHVTRGVRPDDAQIYANLRPTQKYTDVPKQLRRYRDDIFDDKYYRLSMDRFSRTITAHLAKDGYGFIHPIVDRTISVREAARIQTFPDSFRFAGHMTNRFKQIGNAVPPLLARSIGISVASSISNAERAQENNEFSVRTAIEAWHRDLERGLRSRSLNDPWQVLLVQMLSRKTRSRHFETQSERLVEIARTPADLIENWPKFKRILVQIDPKLEADHLITLAQRLVDEHQGTVPRTRSLLTSLPGVCDYVASATLCYGFDQPMVLINSITQRIVKRWTDDPSVSQTRARLRLYEASQPLGPDNRWNCLLTDFARLVCTPRDPACDHCPIRTNCGVGVKIIEPLKSLKRPLS